VKLGRRSFLALASGLLVPEPEPVRAYSFVGGWAQRVAHLSGNATQTIDGVPLVPGARISIYLDHGHRLNGVWTVGVGSWERGAMG
jgi:hypothetical protein